MTFHLSHEQLCDHLLEVTPIEATPVADRIPSPATTVAPGFHVPAPGFHIVEDHLRACPLCAAELSSLQTALGNFHAATTRFANQELSLLRSLYPNRINLQALAAENPSAATHLYRKPFAWAIAAGLVVAASVGAVVPRSLHHPAALHTAAVVAVIHPSTPAAESDQALLEEVDDDLSSNVPSAMQPLSDPISTPSAAPVQEESSAPLSPNILARKITHE